MTDDGEHREKTLQRDMLLVATAGVSLINGQATSPLFDAVFFLLRPFVASAFYQRPMVAFYITSILISLMTLIVAGIPAALYERAKGLAESSPMSLGIWLISTIVLVAAPYLLFQ